MRVGSSYCKEDRATVTRLQCCCNVGQRAGDRTSRVLTIWGRSSSPCPMKYTRSPRNCGRKYGEGRKGELTMAIWSPAASTTSNSVESRFVIRDSLDPEATPIVKEQPFDRRLDRRHHRSLGSTGFDPFGEIQQAAHRGISFGGGDRDRPARKREASQCVGAGQVGDETDVVVIGGNAREPAVEIDGVHGVGMERDRHAPARTLKPALRNGRCLPPGSRPRSAPRCRSPRAMCNRNPWSA